MIAFFKIKNVCRVRIVGLLRIVGYISAPYNLDANFAVRCQEVVFQNFFAEKSNKKGKS